MAERTAGTGPEHLAAADGSDVPSAAVAVQLAGTVALAATDGTVHELPVGNTRVVLAALSLSPSGLTRDELADLVWGEALPPTWEASLRNTISRLRSFLRARLGDDLTVQGRGGGWQLACRGAIAVDVEVARRALDDAENARSNGAWPMVASLAARACDIAAGPFLPGTENEWVDGWRARLHGWRVRALDLCFEALLALGELPGAVGAAEEAVRIEPYRELGYRNLLRAHLAAADRGAGLAAYERCRRVLADALGVPPSEETEALYRELVGTEVAASSRGRARVSEPLVPPRPITFTGRETELAAIEARWAEASCGGTGIVLVTGEPGVGKTWLVLESLHRIRDGGAVVLYGAFDEEGAPFQGVVETLTRFVNGAGEEVLGDLASAARELAVLVPAFRARQQVAVREGDGRVAGEDRVQLFDGVAAAYTAIARNAPLAVVLEDLHWAGAETISLLRHLLRTLAGAPVLFVATARTSLGDEHPVSGLMGQLRQDPGATILDVGGLGADALAELAGAILPAWTDEERRTAVDSIQHATDGNAFLAVELLRSLRERGATALTEDLVVVPEAVRDHIEQRRRSLPEPAGHCVAVGAVAGATFDLATVCAVAGVSEEEAHAGLEKAARAHLVRSLDDPVPRWIFTHALVRDAVLHAINPARRARLHGAIAEVWSRRPDADARAGEILHQLIQAGPAADPTRCYELAMRAGRAALAERAWEAATTTFRVALDSARDDRCRAEAHLELGESMAASGNLETARCEYLAAAEIARNLRDATLFARAVLGLPHGGEHNSDWFPSEADRDLLAEAYEWLEPTADAALRIRLMGHLAFALHRPGELDRRLTLASEAVRQARDLGDDRVLLSALVASRLALSHPSRTPERIALADEVARIAARLGDEVTLFDARMARLSDRAELGDRRGLEADLAAARADADRVRTVMARWRVASWRALLTIIDGDLDGGRRRSDEALALWEGQANTTAVRTWGGQRMTLLTIAGDPAEAAALARVGVEQFGHDVPAYRCALALTLALAGDVDAAAGEIRSFVRDPGLEGWRVDSSWLCGMVTLAEAVAAVGDLEVAEQLLPVLHPLRARLAVAGGLAGLAFWGSTATAVGLLLAALDRPEEALGELRAGAAACAAFGAEPWQRRAEVAAARIAES